jgi:hypothetical protein
MILSNRIGARMVLTGLAVALALSVAPSRGAFAKHGKAKNEKAQSAQAKGKKASQKSKAADKSAKHADKAKGPDHGKSTQIGTFGDWGAYQTQGKSKTCYALAQPKTREPRSMKREAAYIFISERPAENVTNEVSIIMGFPMKNGGEAKAEVGDAEFSLIAKGSNAWIKNPAEESRLVEAMKKGAKLIVKAANAKGKSTTDTYSLSGLKQALDVAHKECR